MHVLVAGCGWLGSAIVRRLVERGDRVTALRRDPARAAELDALGARGLALDLAAPGAEEAIPDADAVVACQAAGGEGAAAYRAAYLDANRALLAAADRAGARAFVYTGSTGVFGQGDGSDVDEETPPRPGSETAEVLVEAERVVLAARGSPRACVVRLSGLYGPGRSGLVERVRSGRAALGPGDDAWMNFCHREDAVRFVVAALDRGAPGGIYHGSDAGPARRREVIAFIAERLGTEPARTSAPAAAGPNRRILSGRTRAALAVELAFPSYREGFAALAPASG